MVTAEELRGRIDKLTQEAEEQLVQGNRDDVRMYQEQVKILQKRLDDLKGGEVLRLDVPCCLGVLLAPQLRARGVWLSRSGWVGDDPSW